MSNKGWAALFVVTIMLTLFVLATTTVTLCKSQKAASLNRFNHLQAYYNAEAGVEEVIAQVKGDSSWAKSYRVNTETTFCKEAERLVKVTRKTASGYDCLEIESTGYCNNGKQKLGVEVLLECPLDFSHGIWVKSFVPDDNADIDSAIYRGKSIPLYNSDYYYTQSKEKHFCESDSPFELELCPETRLGGIYYYEGDLTISGTYKGKGTVAVTGDVLICDILEPADSTSVLTIVSPADILIDSERAECLLYAGGVLTVGEGSFVIGSVIANSLHVLENGAFLFADRWGSEATDTVTDCFQLLTWEERIAY